MEITELEHAILPLSDCIPDATGRKCVNCGWERPPDDPSWHHTCPKHPSLVPAAKRLGLTLEDIGHYVQAILQWTAAGFPVREQTEVERIEREICRPCENYIKGRCKKCSCRVTASGIALVNKIKMATEHCPLAKWPGDPPQTTMPPGAEG